MHFYADSILCGNELQPGLRKIVCSGEVEQALANHFTNGIRIGCKGMGGVRMRDEENPAEGVCLDGAKGAQAGEKGQRKY